MASSYAVKKPCDDCPFLRVGGIRLRRGFVRELARNILGEPGKTFACHKTVRHDDDGEHIPRPDAELHCAGALIFAEKHQHATQMTRIAERVGAYDARALMADAGIVASVFDDEESMLAACVDAPPRRRRQRA